MGGSAPYGYTIAFDGSLEISLDEAPMVSETFSMALSGSSTATIAKLRWLARPCSDSFWLRNTDKS